MEEQRKAKEAKGDRKGKRKVAEPEVVCGIKEQVEYSV